MFVAPPGSGKTVLGIYLAAARGRSVLVLVHRGQILDQWRAQLAAFLDLPATAVGQIGAGKEKPTGKIDVAMVQSLVRGDRVDDAVARYGHVIFDECHHLPAVSFERVAAELKARYVLGLTATPYRNDGLHPILHMQCGPIRHAISVRDAAASQAFVRRLVVRNTAFEPPAAAAEPGIQDVYRALVADDRRNTMILDDVIAALEERRSPIVLTERVEHLEWLEWKLRGCTKNLVVRLPDGSVRGQADRDSRGCSPTRRAHPGSVPRRPAARGLVHSRKPPGDRPGGRPVVAHVAARGGGVGEEAGVVPHRRRVGPHARRGDRQDRLYRCRGRR